MRFQITRQGVIALAVTVAVAGAAGAGAWAQEGLTEAPVETSESAADPASSNSEIQPEIRFVAEPVVQPLPAASETAAARHEAKSLRELIDTMPTEAVMSRDLTCLAQAIYFESRGESLGGQLAVAEVVINRSESGRFPNDYCGVVTQPGQFSFVRGGRIPAVGNSAAWSRAKAVARIAHEELWESGARDALYFHARRVSPGWSRQRVATIDNHVFYR